MGGVQQMQRLVLKNILLKKRRPKATCFEIILPIVLFVILAFLRKYMETKIKYKGPYYYENNTIFPLSASFAEGGASTLEGEMKNLFCSQDFRADAVSFFEPLFSENSTHWQWLQSLDPAEASAWVEEQLEKVQQFDVPGMISNLEEARRLYLESSYPEQVQNAAGNVDEELAALRGELDNATAARLRVEGLVDDTCDLRGPLFDGMLWNSSELAHDLARLHHALKDAGIVDWVHSSLRSHYPGVPGWESNESAVDECVDEMIRWPSHFLTNSTYLGRAILTQDGDGSLRSLMESLGHVMQDLGYDDAVAIASEVMKFLGHVMEDLDNDTAAIVSEVLPSWGSTWREACEAARGLVIDSYMRTHSGCPFFRNHVSESGQVNVSEWVQDQHDRLENLNMTSLEEQLLEWQQDLQDYDASDLGGHVRSFLERAAQEHLDSLGRARVLVDEMRAAACSGHGQRDGLEEEDDDYDGDDTYLSNQVVYRRKVLVAPYVGEVEQLWDLMMVEIAASMTNTEAPGGGGGSTLPAWAQALVRCPLVQGYIAKRIDSFLQEHIVTFATEEELIAWATANPEDTLLGLVFRSADEASGNFPSDGLNVDFAIRMHSQYMPPTDKIFRYTRNAMFGGDSRTQMYHYIEIGFTLFQDTIGRAAARLRAQREARDDGLTSPVARNVAAHGRTEQVRSVSVGVQQFPAPRYRLDRFIYQIQYMLPMFMVLGWIYAVSLLVKEIVYEKQERLRDVMRIMGLKTWVYWCSWVISAMSQLTILSCLLMIFLSGFNILTFSSPAIVLLFLWVYSMSVVSFAMAVSACFSRAKVAAACTGLFYYTMYLPYNFYGMYEEKTSTATKCMYCLSAPTGLGVGMSIIAKWELVEEGLQWSNIASPPPMTSSGAVPMDDFSFAHVLMMLLLDSVAYQVLAWYLEKVFPGTLGLPQPFYFPFLPSYWLGARAAESAACSQEGKGGDAGAEQQENAGLECYEAPPAGMGALVRIRRLTKTFSGGKRALKGISLDMHDGMIVGLLGHNGAGKSTTMAILTGLYAPTEGDVLVNGCSVRKDSHGVRKQLGMCPQHNALYELLTVEEHLTLFCHLKTVPRSEVAAQVSMLLADTGLVAKRHAPSKSLSGGMKRKLSIGMALAGGSRVIALDEPTAGVDATSRREIWHLLAGKKAHRTILLSTHFMDEADVLSDRIAIIAEGRLTAIGTSMSLKRHFADGYLLTLVLTDRADAAELFMIVKAAVPEAECVGSRGREVSYALPAAARPRFASLFERLQDDATRDALGIDTYGLSAATMEEVFLRASSVHEEGLHGRVRNAGEGAGRTSTAPRPPSPPTPPPQLSKEAVESFKEADPVPGELSTSTSLGASSAIAHENSVTSLPRSKWGRAKSEEASTASPSVKQDEESSEGGSSSGPRCATPPGHAEASTASPSVKQEEESSEGGSSSLPRCATPPRPVEAPWSCVPTVPLPAASKDAWPEEHEAQKSSPKLLEGMMLEQQQFRARLRMRAHSALRDRKAWASQLAFPAAFVLLALVIAMAMQIKADSPALRLSNDMYIDAIKADIHTMPMFESGDTALGDEVARAFDEAKGRQDDLVELDLGGVGHTPMSDYLMDTAQDMVGSSYGAVSIEGHAAEGDAAEAASVVLWFKNQAYHAIPSMLHMCNVARLRLLGFDDTRTQAWSHPFPKTHNMLQEEMTSTNQVFTDLTVAITMILAMGFIPASFVVHLVHERATNAKHQQLLTGVSPAMYWFSSYCWDMINYLVPMLFCFAIFAVFQIGAYSGDNTTGICVLLFLYGACMTPLMYCLEPLFAVPSTAYVTLICTNIFTGTVSVLSTAVMDSLTDYAPEVVPVNNVLKEIFPFLFPNYCLGRGMIDIATNHYIRYAAKEFGICFKNDCDKDTLAWDVGGRHVFALGVMVVFWLSLRMLIEWRVFTRCSCLSASGAAAPRNTMVDGEVQREAQRISEIAGRGHVGSSDKDQNPLVVSGLRKSFVLSRSCRKKAEVHSVRGVSVGVAPGECFGLLGVNGAGKTTTMKMITGHIEIGGGDVFLSGWSVKTHRDKARRHLGYCPQFDALPDKLTVRDTLEYYARIRGIEGSAVASTVDSMIQRMCLEAHQQRLCQHLSGGNKRKVSTAMALIGEPDVVLLDEPSTGIDVGARRFLWDVLGGIRQRGHALVLTSHSMDECEVLCTRLTVMVSGEFRCLGSPLQLKAKYGGGYTLAVKLQQAVLERLEPAHEELGAEEPPAKGDDARARFCDFMAEALPAAHLTEENVGLFRYRLGGGGAIGEADVHTPTQRQQVSLAHVFKIFEESALEGGALHQCISDYTLSQTTLEEVFLHFSQLAEREEVPVEQPASEVIAH